MSRMQSTPSRARYCDVSRHRNAFHGQLLCLMENTVFNGQLHSFAILNSEILYLIEQMSPFQNEKDTIIGYTHKVIII